MSRSWRSIWRSYLFAVGLSRSTSRIIKQNLRQPGRRRGADPGHDLRAGLRLAVLFHEGSTLIQRAAAAACRLLRDPRPPSLCP